MKKVTFVRIESKLHSFVIGRGLKFRYENTRKVILEKAKEGYSYKGFVPVEVRGNGNTSVIDLIFEKEE